ncbi:unnamed protein product [Umbelopsis sp. WA50703]
MAAMVSIVSAASLAATGTFEIVSPTPQAIYVAGQILPVIYTVNSDIVAQKALELSVYISPAADSHLNITTRVITPNADVGSSPRVSKGANGVFVFEHAVNFNIPKDAPAGNYDVVFADSVMHVNTTVPVVIKAAASSPSSLSFSPGATATATNHINNQVNPAPQPSSFLASSASHFSISIISTTMFGALTSALFF